jgi:hypothetical protein
MSPLLRILVPPALASALIAVFAIVRADDLLLAGSGLGLGLAVAAGLAEVSAAGGRRTLPVLGALTGTIIRLGGILAIGHTSPMAAIAAAPALIAGLIAMPTAVSAAIARKPARA